MTHSLGPFARTLVLEPNAQKELDLLTSKKPRFSEVWEGIEFTLSKDPWADGQATSVEKGFLLLNHSPLKIPPYDEELQIIYRVESNEIILHGILITPMPQD